MTAVVCIARLIGVAVIVAVFVGGCSSSPSGQASEEQPSTTETSERDASDGMTSSSIGGPSQSREGTDLSPTTAVPAESGGAAQSESRSSTSTTLPTIDVEAEVAEDCIRRGTMQTITIRTEPNTGVAYHAIYSDGSNGFDEDYPGGNNTGETDSEGAWDDTWTVGPTAAEGEVKVDVVALGSAGQGSTNVTFEVADLTGSCD